MNIWLQSKPPRKISVNKNDFAAEGGEGQVYLLNDLAIKLYKDPAKCISKGKIDELAALAHKQILRPLYLTVDDKGRPLGYAMKRLVDGLSLCKLFTNDFRNRNGITPENTIELIRKIESVLKVIHNRGCLVVDVNDMNIMVSEKNLTTPFFIDVDSYQSTSYPAAAIMPSVKDYHATKLTTMSDWFSYSILAFQLIVGIHPFKGTHPLFKRSDLEGRMRSNVSVLNNDVTLPRTARSLDLIPQEYRQWFESLYVHGQRMEPPGAAGPIILSKPATSTKGTVLELTLESEQLTSITDLFDDIIVTVDGAFDWKGRKQMAGRATDVYLRAPLTNELIRARVENKNLELKTNRQELNLTLAADSILPAGKNYFIRSAGRLTAVTLNEIGGRIIPSVGQSWAVMPYATEMFEQIAVQNALGATWLVLPGNGVAPTCQIIHVPELDGLRIKEAQYQQGLAMILSGKGEAYELHILRINETNGTYRIETEKDVDYHAPSFTVLDNGIVAHLRFDGKLALFHRDKGATGQVLFEDPQIKGNMRITSCGNRTYLIDDNRLYRLKTKTGR